MKERSSSGQSKDHGDRRIRKLRRRDSQLRYRVESGKVVIDLQVRSLNQLFDSRDPSPFRERDLDEKAVEYMVSAAEEIGVKEPLKIVIHYSKQIDGELRVDSVPSAIHSFFEYEADILRRRVALFFQNGRVSLGVGFLSLFVLLGLAESVANSNIPLGNILREGFMITGWVALWTPLNTFLYGWWPIKQKERCYEKLSRTEVVLVCEA
ncbi:MAG: hypothetical protein IPL83_04270 [Bdellovibrionales bacterium]|nr:hypothetical protein [Bdellovibrionales bacterium]